MFKIESYVTPLILSYVSKYVKNIRPEDSQLSLWGGDAVFSNLDLRLEALEQELRLPFRLVNGHIHELRIHVPWTKLTSEPVVVTINTIECVLRLGDTSSAGSSASSSSASSAAAASARLRRVSSARLSSTEGSSQSLAQPPSGYLSGLLQRVLHNVTIVLNNVILKYAEEDLVLSLNIKSVELASADAAWQPAFAQLWAEDLVLRKLISMQDVTVCLDKRDASGKIEAYQEPLLYRCFMAGRVHMPYDGAGNPVAMRCHLSCERLDLSLTDQQLPLFLRLLKLCLALYYGRLSCSPGEEPAAATASSQERAGSPSSAWMPSGAFSEGGAADDQDQGWGAWAWSMVPQILPAWEEEPGMEGSPGDAHLGDAAPWPTLYHLGCYVEKMTCIFKTTAEESTGRGTRRQSLAGRPLVQLELHGSTAELALRGVTWVHFQAGVTGVAISGSEHCACGFEETARRGRHKGLSTYLRAGVTAGSHTYSHLTGSLFDPLAPENSGLPREPEPGLDGHVERLTELAMAERFPALCLDYLYELQVPEDWDDSEESVEICAAFLETSNWVERSLCRSVIGPSVVDITSGAVHRVLWLLECATSVPQRPAYGPEEFEPVHFPLPLPDEEQLERMSQFAPSRTYRLTVLKPRIRLCPSTHCAGDAPRQQTLLRRRSLREESPVSGGGPATLPGSCLPLLELQVECLDVSLGRPMYPGKMTSLLATDEGRLPESLRHQCFSHLQAKLFGLSVDLASASSKAASRPPARVALLDPARATFRCQWVPCPPLLAHGPESLARTWGCLEVGPLRLSASKQRAMAALGVALSWPWGPGVAATLGASSLVGNLSGEGSPMIQLSVGRASWTFSEDAHSTTHSADVVSVSAVLHDKDRSTVLVRAPENTAQVVHLARHEGDSDRDLNRAEESWIRATARVPLDWTKEAETGFVVVKVKGVVLVCDPALVTWLAPLPMIFPTGSEFSPGPAPFSPTASDDGGLTFSDERSQDLPREARGSASGSQRSGPSLTSPPVAVGLPKRTNPASSEVSQWSNPAGSRSNLGVRGWLRSAYTRLRTFSVQVGVANVCLLFPKSPLLLSFPRQELGPPDAGVPCILPRWRRHLREGAAGSVACLLLPALNVTSTDPKSKRGPTTGGTAEHHESSPGERFPWCVRLGSSAAFEAHGVHVRHVLKPASLSCTVALTSSQGQDRRPSQLGLCIHVDVEPCHLSLSAKQIDSIRQTVLLLASLRRSFGDTLGWYRQASAVPSSAESFVSSALGHRFPVPKLVPSRSVSLTESCDKVPEVPSGSVSGARDDAGIGPTLWLQWTLPKVGINLFGSGSEGSSAKDVWLQLEAEEVTASLDVQEVYSKVKLKMSTFNISCFEKSSAAVADTAWEPGPYEGVVFSCSEKLNRQTSVGKSATAAALGQQPKQTDFLNLTWTRALCAHVRRNMHKPRKDFTPLTEVERQAVKPRYLSEVDLRLAAFDIVLHTRVAAVAAEVAAPLHRLTDLLRVPPEASAPPRSAPKRPKGWELNSRALPLVYLASGTVRVFLPVDGGDAERCAPSGRGDVCLLQCGATSLSPQVENPLCRRALREDLYSWAQEQGVLTAVGSDLEDRQYQLHLSAFFLCTLNWQDLVGRGAADSSLPGGSGARGGAAQPCTTLMGENPAFEWNRQPRGACTLPRGTSGAPVPLTPVTSCCDLHVTLAPAMVFAEVAADGTQQEVLVCGHSVEASIPSDLHCHLSLDQLSLLHRVLSQLWHTGTLMGKFASSSAAGASAERGSFAGPRATPDFRDSGLESDLSEAPGSTQADGASQSPLDFVPFDLLLTAATISLTLGLVEVDDRPLSGGQRSPPCSDEDDVGYDASEDSDSHVGDDAAATLRHRRGSGGARMVPLARVVVLQPHAFLSCSPSEQRAEMSCFDVQVGGVPSGFRAPGFNLSELASPGTFVEPWLETRPGEPHPKTGIPPSLFTLSLQGFLLPQVSLCVKVGRPLRVNLGASKVDQALQFAELAASQLMTARSSRAPPPQTAPTPSRSSSYTETETMEVTSVKQWRLSAKLETDQLVLVLDFPMDLSNFKATLALESHTSEIDVECSPLGMPLGLQSRTTLAALQLYATSGQHRVSLAGPSTVSLCTDTFWERLSGLPAAHCILRVHCDVVPLRAGPMQLRLCAAAVQHAVQLIASVAERLDRLIPHVDGNEVQKPAETSKEAQHGTSWLDDLRNGSFQYIQDDGIPNPNEIVFRRPLKSGEPGVMTWRYPEPRILTRVDVYPVPFSSTGKQNGSAPPQLQCDLQYWEPCQEQFVTYQQFELSESEPHSLDLPSLAFCSQDQPPPVVVADTWRVVILAAEQPAPRHAEEGPTSAATAMSPLALAACMRVDSHFDPGLVPRLRASLSVDTCLLVLDVPSAPAAAPLGLWPFELDESSTPGDLDFAEVSLNQLCLSYTGWQHRTNLGVNGRVSCDVTELHHMSRLTVLDPVDVRATAVVCQPPNGDLAIEADLVIEPCYLRVSQSVVHTLSTAAAFWDKDAGVSIPLSYIAVCNDTQDVVCFGQVGTSERIVLQPGHMHTYTWKSRKAPLQLRLSTEGQHWKWSSPFSLSSGREVAVEVASGSSPTTFLVRTRCGHGIESQVIISGQVTLRCHLLRGLQIQLNLADPNSKEPTTTARPPKTRSIQVDLGDRASRSLVLDPKRIYSFHVCRVDPAGPSQNGLSVATTWSNEVELQSRFSKDWVEILEVPQDTGGKLRLWCYCVSGRIGLSANVLVLAFVPLHILRSHLPCSLLVHLHRGPRKEEEEEEGVARGTLSVPGRGRDSPLLVDPVPTSLTFQLGPGMRVSSPALQLLPPTLDHETLVADSPRILEQLRDPQWPPGSPYCAKWPYHDPQRMVEVDHLTEKGALLPQLCSPSSSGPEHPQEMPETELRVSQYQDFPFAGTVLVDIKPWALVVNCTGQELRLVAGDHGVWTLAEGQVFAPPALYEPFYLGLEDGGDLHCSSRPLMVDRAYLLQRKESPQAPLDSAEQLLVGKPIPVCIPFRRAGSSSRLACRLVALASDFEGCLVVTLRSAVCLTNQTPLPLTAAGFVMAADPPYVELWTASKEMAGQCRLQPGDRHGRDTVPLLLWNGDDEADNGDTGRFYLSLALAGDGQETLGSCSSPWSFPVGLDGTAPDVRRTTSAPRVAGALHTTVPLVVTCHTRDGTIYAVVARDANPLLHISNATCATLAFAESGEATEGTRGSLMLWSVPPGCSVHFTPPSLSAHCSGTAPGSERGTPQLLLACVREGGNPLMSWSSPVACTDVANQFVRIPNLGDVRISAHRVCQTTHLLVQVVSRAEVSAKEIRSRIGESGPVMEVELRGSPDEMALGGQTGQSVPVTRSSPPRVLQEDLPAVSPLGRSLRFASLSVAKFCLIICDESNDYRTSDPRDHRPTELIRLSLDSLSCVVRPRSMPHHPPRTPESANAASVVYDLFAFVGGLQLDNQLAGGEVSDEVFDFPVVLVPQEDSAPMQGCQDAVVSVTLSLELHPGGRAAVDSLVVKLRPLSLFVEDTLLYRVARMASFLRPLWCHAPIAANTGDRRLSAEVAESSLALVRTVPVRELVLEPLMVRLSVHASLKLFLSLNGTPLSFARFSRTNLVTGCYQLGQLLTRHYVTGALFRAGWVVGSLDLLGNPTGLVRALGSGVSALVVLPYRGLVQGRPWAFLMGVSHGTSTMLRHISSGALSSVTQLATSVSRNLDRLSLDPEHLAWKESLRTGPSAGLGQGLSTLGISLLGAVAGIVDHPMQALIHEESRGPTGFVKGLGRGLVGAVAKPISGAAELVAQTGKGILQGTGWGECSRRRHQAQPSRDGPSSEARLRASLSGQELLLALQVELLQDGNASQPLVLVLTWQCLFLLSEADGVVERCFPLLELSCAGSPVDPSRVALDLEPPQSGMQHDRTATRARVRVAEYVTRTSPYPSPSSDQDGGDCEPSAPSGVTCLVRLLQPNLRPWLLARFAEAKKAALGKGFHSPHS